MSEKEITEECKSLLSTRDEIDRKLEELGKVLEANDVTMDTPLVDEEGFPRNDIDVYTIRHTRSEIITLRNDRKNLDDKIEKLLGEIHKLKKENADEVKEHEEEVVHRTSNVPFVKIVEVTPHSPADNGNLVVGDEVIQFGKYHRDNFKELTDLQGVVLDHENKPIRITVLRYGRPVRLTVTPQKWSGQGLFGALFSKM
ncbi:26S proteasome non-ATPase regulatory subunit 9 [Strongyloides ratti]|uniref:26S proteasome non-ATPase regulatory subunit 9 n=1 Tax=Strongyloides ratti TaxID=34506 RepID=A0A090KWT9_STRRB|nr:26S proteasome non-ATPase regulatory subunit 9 [Strongyloides ratti]CEF61975.1 26S proteasome non-ATPase regulatory subunit 9 [Strongyloides ratti]